MKILALIVFVLVALCPVAADAQLLVDECCWGPDAQGGDWPDGCAFIECCAAEDCVERYGGESSEWECVKGQCNLAGFYQSVFLPAKPTADRTIRTWIAEAGQSPAGRSACLLTPAP